MVANCDHLASPVHPPRRLIDQVHDAISARHHSRRTGRAHAGWIRRLVPYHGRRHPEEMGEPEVTAFLSHLATHRRVGALLAELDGTVRLVASPLDEKS